MDPISTNYVKLHYLVSTVDYSFHHFSFVSYRWSPSNLQVSDSLVPKFGYLSPVAYPESWTTVQTILPK